MEYQHFAKYCLLFCCTHSAWKSK